jgi:multiple sugar transport system permease protein
MVSSKHSWKAWLYLAPAIILLLVFTVWPIANSVVMAFNQGYDAMVAASPDGFKFNFGFENFAKAFDKGSNFIIRGFDDIPRKGLGALGNTMLLTVITVPVSTLLALLIAVALNSIKPLQRFYQTVFFLPYVTNSIAIGLVFQAMFNVEVGSAGVFNFLIQPILQPLGIEYIDWIGVESSYWAKVFVTSVYIIWNALPFKILILLGGLQSVSKQYYDATKVDGTSRFRVFTRITVPLLSPMLSYVIITSFISGFKEYSSVVALFKNDTMVESGQLSTMVGYIYQFIGGDNSKYGAAAAAALILFAIIFAVTMVNLYVSKKNTHY